MTRLAAILSTTTLAVVLAAAGGPGEKPRRDPLDELLDRVPVTTAPATRRARTRPKNPFAGAMADNFSRTDALPAAAVLSDGKLLAGGLYTTRRKDLEIWLADQRRWRHVPLICVRGIHAVVVSESMDPEWRWKEMGSDEKVYTGRKRPVRRLEWRLNLIDGSSLQGEIKGQPLWIERGRRRTLWVLHARTKGEYGQTLAELVYPRQFVISRREMDRVGKILDTADGKATPGDGGK